MKHPRVGFACTVDNLNQKIFVVGGTGQARKALALCEFYSIEDNIWHDLPSLPEPRYSCSICLMGKDNLLCFGGNDSSNKLTNTIFFVLSLNQQQA